MSSCKVVIWNYTVPLNQASCTKFWPHVPNLDLMYQIWTSCTKLGTHVPNLYLMHKTWTSCSKLGPHVQTWTSCSKLGLHVPNLDIMSEHGMEGNNPRQINTKCSLKPVDWSVNKTRLRGLQSAVCTRDCIDMNLDY